MGWLDRIFRRKPRLEGPVKFSAVRYYRSMGNLTERLPLGQMAIVGDEQFPKWAIFYCPCGRGHQIQLSLQHSHRPHWQLRVRSGLPTLMPSVWLDKPTGCHFWIVRGRVAWFGGQDLRHQQKPGPIR